MATEVAGSALGTDAAPAAKAARPRRPTLLGMLGVVLVLALAAVALVQARQFAMLKQSVVSGDVIEAGVDGVGSLNVRVV